MVLQRSELVDGTENVHHGQELSAKAPGVQTTCKWLGSS